MRGRQVKCYYCNITFLSLSLSSKWSWGQFIFLISLPLPLLLLPPSFPFLCCLVLPLSTELAALNGGHWAVRPRPPQPLSTLAPLSPWPKKNTACTALAGFYLSSSPRHVGPTSRSWRSWTRTLAGDLSIIRPLSASIKTWRTRYRSDRARECCRDEYSGPKMSASFCT